MPCFLMCLLWCIPASAGVTFGITTSAHIASTDAAMEHELLKEGTGVKSRITDLLKCSSAQPPSVPEFFRSGS